jgi:WD40 repeat protein
VVTNASDPSHETAEVVHEALIRNWPMLKGWIDRDRAFLSWRGQIRSNVELWSVDPSDDGPLLRSGMLAQASDWFARRGDDFSPAERAYIETSLALRQREEDRKEAARQAEIRNQQELAEAARKLAREQGRRAKIAVAGVIVALLLALFGAWQTREADQQARKAEKQTRTAQLQEARAVSLQARDATERGDAMTGMLAALAVMPDAKHPRGRARSAHAATALLEAWSNDREIATMIGHTDTVVGASFSPDGQRVVTASVDETARVWDVSGATPAVPPEVLSGHTGEVTSASFSPDGKQVVTASWDKTARVWDVSGAIPHAPPMVLSGHMGEVTSASFSPDGKQVVTTSSDKTARIWDLTRPDQKPRVLQSLDQVLSASFSPDGKYVVTASLDNTARVWDLSHPEKTPTLLQGHAHAVVSASFSPHGKQVVTASLDQTVRIWDLTRPDQKPKVLQNAASVNSASVNSASVNSGPVNSVPVISASFSRDGKQLVTTSFGRAARVWDLTWPDPKPKPLYHPAQVLSASFSPDGRYVVTTTLDHTARVGTPLGPERRQF